MHQIPSKGPALPRLLVRLAAIAFCLLAAAQAFGSTCTISPSVPVSGSAVTVTYTSTNGPLSGASNIYVFPGINGYALSFVERPMTYNAGTGQYTCTFWISELTTTLNLSFTDGNNNWDNNNNSNWNFTVTPSTPPSTITPPSLSSSASQSDVMMEGFYWDVPAGTWYSTMAAQAATLRNMQGGQGIDRIWFPPPSKGQSGGLSMGYDPYDYYDLGQLNQESTTATRFGTQAQLISTISAFQAQNVACMADIVLNHRSGGNSESNPNLSGSSTLTDFSGVASGMCTWHYNQFHPSTFELNDDGVFGGYPDICHITGTTAGSARYDLLTWGSWLTNPANAGFDGGWRFDYVLGYRPSMVAAFRAATNNAFGVMECEYTNISILDQYVSYSGGASTFDFGLNNSFIGVFASGTESIADLVNPAITYVAHNPSKAVTFVANHDTDLVSANKMLAYAFILTYQGYPCIFWYDYFNNGLATLGGQDGNGINRLVWVRGALAGGQPSIQVLKNNDTDFLVYGTLAGTGTTPGYIVAINNDPVNSRSASVTTSNSTLKGRTLRCCAWYSYVTGSNVQPAAINSNGSGTVTVMAPPSGYAVYGPVLALTNTSAVTSGTSGFPYSAALGATGGTAPYTFAVTNGTLPTGLSLSSFGLLSGTPTTNGTFNFQVQVTDSTGLQCIQSFNVATAYLLPAVTTGGATAVGGTSDQAIATATVNPNISDATAWFEWGPTTSYGNTTRSQAGDNAESYSSWDYSSNSNGGSGFGPATYLEGNGGGIFLTNSSNGNLQIDGNNSFVVFAGAGGQGLCRAILSPHQVGTYSLSARFAVDNSSGFSGFNLKSAQGSVFGANEMLSFGMAPYTGNNAIYVRDAGGTETINLGAQVTGTGNIIDFQLNYDAATGGYTLGAKFRTSPSYTTVSGTMLAVGVTPTFFGFANFNTGSFQDLVFDDLQWVGSDSIGSGTSPVVVSGTLSGLQLGTVYHYRAGAQNSGGISYGPDQTLGSPAVITTSSPLPAGVAGFAYSQAFASTGGTPPLTWSVTSGSLPPGLALSSSGLLSGTPTAAGVYTFGIQAAGSLSPAVTGTYSLSVALGLANASAVTNGASGFPYSVALSATGGTGPYTFTLTSGTLPIGLSLSSAGVLSGIPTSTGTFSFTVLVTDSGGLTGSQSFTITTGYFAPTVITGTASAIGLSNTQAFITGTINPNANETTTWFEWGPTSSYGSTTRGLASDNAESYTAWNFNTNNNGGTGFGPVQYLQGTSGGIYLVNNSSGGGEIDGNNSFGIYASTGGQAVCRAILSPHEIGTYTLSAVFDVDNTKGFSGFNLKSSEGSTFTAGELLAFGMAPGTGNNSIYVRTSGTQTINLGSGIPGSIVDFQVNYDATSGAYTLGAKFRSNQTFATVSGTMEAVGQDPTYLGFENYNTGSLQNLIFDDLQLVDADSIGSGTTPVIVSTTLTGLQAGTVYHYHAAAQNALGTTYGADQTFGSPATITTTSPLPGGVVGSAYSQALASTGGTQPLTWSVISGSLPPGLILSSSGLLSGTPSAAGTYTFGTQVAGTLSPAATGTFSMTVALEFTNIAAVISGTSGFPYSATLSVTGGVGPYTFTLLSGTLPTGLSLSSAGLLSGTPASTGTFSFTLNATDANGSTGSQSFSISSNYLPPTAVTGAAAAVGISTTQALVTGTVNPNATETTTWFEYGLTASYGSTTRGLASDNAESYTAWNYNTNTNGGTGFGPVQYLAGTGGGIYLANDGAQIDGSNSFAVFSSTGGQSLCRSILSPHQVGAYSLSAVFDVDNTNGFSGFNLKSAQGSTFTANELVAFGMNPSAGNNAIYVRDGSGTQSINLGSGIPGSIIDFQLNYDATSGAYTLGAKFRSSETYTTVSGTMEAVGQDPAVIGFQNNNTGTSQNLIYDDLQLVDADSIGSGITPVLVSTTLSGLQPNTVYHFRIDSQNAFGLSYGVDQTFGTPAVIATTSPLPAGVAGSSYSQQFAATGGTPPLAWAIVGGALPPGLGFSSAGLLSGTPTASGTYGFTVQLGGTANLPISEPFSLSVALALTNPASVLSGTYGFPYSISLAASGGTGPYSFILLSGTLPPGLTLSSSGLLSGIPNSTGTYSFTIQATDANGIIGLQSFTIPTSYLLPAAFTGSASAVGTSTTNALVTGTFNPDGAFSTTWFEYGTTASYGSSTRTQASDNAESYSSWSYNTNGGSGFGPVTYLEGVSGGIFLANGGAQIDGNNSFGVYSSNGTQGLCRSILSPRQVGTYSLSANFNIDNTKGFSGFNLKSAPGSSFIANELLAFGLNPSTGNNSIFVRASTNQTINLGSSIPNSVIDFIVYYDEGAGIYTLGAKFRTSQTYTYVSGTLEATGQNVATIGFANFNSGSVQNLIFDDLAVTGCDAIASGTAPILVSSTLASLQPNTVYHFRVDAQNAGGITYGADQTFGTPAVIATSSPLPAAIAGSAYSQQFAASGGTPPLAWSVTTGTLPPGLNFSSSGLLSGTPTTSGTYGFTVQLGGAANLPISEPFSVSVALAITNTASVVNGASGYPYSVSLGASGGTGPYTFLLLTGTLPPGLTLSSAGLLSGTPTSTGTYSFTLQATDANGFTGSQSFTISTAYLPPAVTTGGVSAIGTSTTQALVSGTVTSNASDSTAWFEYGTTASYGSSTRSQASDNAESYSGWDYNTNTNGGSGFGPVTYLDGVSGGIFLANGGAQIDGSNSFGVYSSNGTQGLCRSILSPHQVGTYSLSAKFNLNNTTGFSGFNLKYAQGSSFIANELVAFGLNPSTGNNSIFVRGGTNQAIDLGSSILNNIIDFVVNYDAAAGTYTLGAKFRTSQTYTYVSGTLEANGQNVTTLGFGNYNSGSLQNLIFDDLQVVCSDSVGSGTSPVLLSSTLSGLSANTLYHYRVDGLNPAGTALGADQTFGTTIVTATATSDAYESGTLPGIYTLSQSGTAPLSVNYSIAGSATAGTRYTVATSPLTFSSSTATLLIYPILNDSTYYGDQTATLLLTSGTNYLAGATTPPSITVHDTPFNDWKYQYFGANANNPAISGLTANPSGDGVVNLLKFLLGQNPLLSSPQGLPTASVHNGAVLFTFTTVSNPGTVTWTVEYSSDLVNWTTAVNGQNGVTITSTPVSGGTQVTVSIPQSGSRVFARLRATLQ